MIIKSHIRGGYRSAAEYLKEQGQNEKIRLVEIRDPEAKNLDEAFQNMWKVADDTKCKKPLHHISINPMKDERLTDKQVLAIVARCEEKYGYLPGQHQRVIVEHIKDGRQHFHVIWNRVNMITGKTVWPGEHWNKSKQVCREMEKELGLKRPMPRQLKKAKHRIKGSRYRANTKTGTRHLSGPRKVIRRASVKYKTLAPAEPSIFIGRSSQAKEKQPPLAVPTRPARTKTGWPLAAIIDWQAWGHRNPKRFFALWPQLSG